MLLLLSLPLSLKLHAVTFKKRNLEVLQFLSLKNQSKQQALNTWTWSTWASVKREHMKADKTLKVQHDNSSGINVSSCRNSIFEDERKEMKDLTLSS